MKSIIFMCLAGVGVLSMTGCLQQSDEDIMRAASEFYHVLEVRYQELLGSSISNGKIDEELTDDKIICRARAWGTHVSVTGWSGIWNDFIGNKHLTRAEGAPLHRATYVIESDIDYINTHVGYLEARMLFDAPVCKKLREIRSELQDMIMVIKVCPDYIEEGRYIEQRHSQDAQLLESRRQTELLRDIACNQ